MSHAHKRVDRSRKNYSVKTIMYISLSRSPKQGTKATGTQGITACGTIRKKKHYQGANSEEELSGGQ